MIKTVFIDRCRANIALESFMSDDLDYQPVVPSNEVFGAIFEALGNFVKWIVEKIKDFWNWLFGGSSSSSGSSSPRESANKNIEKIEQMEKKIEKMIEDNKKNHAVSDRSLDDCLKELERINKNLDKSIEEDRKKFKEIRIAAAKKVESTEDFERFMLSSITPIDLVPVYGNNSVATLKNIRDGYRIMMDLSHSNNPFRNILGIFSASGFLLKVKSELTGVRLELRETIRAMSELESQTDEFRNLSNSQQISINRVLEKLKSKVELYIGKLKKYDCSNFKEEYKYLLPGDRTLHVIVEREMDTKVSKNSNGDYDVGVIYRTIGVGLNVVRHQSTLNVYEWDRFKESSFPIYHGLVSDGRKLIKDIGDALEEWKKVIDAVLDEVSLFDKDFDNLKASFQFKGDSSRKAREHMSAANDIIQFVQSVLKSINPVGFAGMIGSYERSMDNYIKLIEKHLKY